MPWHVAKTSACPVSRPYGVVKDADGKVVGCHPTRDAAMSQIRALYASERASNSNRDVAIPNITPMSAKELHDRWLEQKPEAAEHATEDCPFCSPVEPAGRPGVAVSEKTYSEDELKAAVAAAIQPFEAKMNELVAEKSNEAVEARIAEARTDLETKISEVQGELDVKVAELSTAKLELEDYKTAVATEKAEADAEAEKAARKAERVEKILEVADLPEDHVTANEDRWAAMGDEEFAALLETMKAAGVKKSDKKDDSIPDTKLQAGRETSGREGESALSGIMDVRRSGFNTRQLASKA